MERERKRKNIYEGSIKRKWPERKLRWEEIKKTEHEEEGKEVTKNIKKKKRKTERKKIVS